MWAGCSNRLLQKGLTVQASVFNLVEDFLHKLPPDVLDFSLVLCWLLWHRRNRVVHGGILQEPGALVGRASSLLDEYLGARTQLVSSMPHVSSDPSQKWQPPLGLTYKMNYDAAVFNGLPATGVGVVIQNGDGQVMAALASRGPAVMDSEEAEVLACRRALEFAIDAGFADLVVEGDNSNMLRSVVSSQPDWSRLGNIYDDVRYLAARLRFVEFKCIRRSANGVAHSLARYARQINDDCIWLEETPVPAQRALYEDSVSLLVN